jgi:hypothetical protein
MTTAFNPRDYFIQLPQKRKNPATGQWETTLTEYLPVAARVAWFRADHPHGTIDAVALTIDFDKGLAIFQATVEDGEGGKAVAYAHETRAGFADFLEKSHTRAVGRALALLGYGSTTAGEELSEGGHVADAPVDTTMPTNVNTIVEDIVSGSDTSVSKQASSEVHPTADEISTLVDSARSANVSNDDFAHDMRRLMQLPDGQKVTKKFLRETMTMTQYNTARAHYGEKLRQILEEDVQDFPAKESNHGNHAAQEPAPEPTPAASGEAPAGTFGSSSSANAEAAPAADPTEADRARLRAEVATWDLTHPPEEVDRIIRMHSPEKARLILWRLRPRQPAAAPLTAAD